jgi:hypothetical protein
VTLSRQLARRLRVLAYADIPLDSPASAIETSPHYLTHDVSLNGGDIGKINAPLREAPIGRPRSASSNAGAWTAPASSRRRAISIYEGGEFQGRVVHTLVRGRPVLREATLVADSAGWGRYISTDTP